MLNNYTEQFNNQNNNNQTIYQFNHKIKYNNITKNYFIPLSLTIQVKYINLININIKYIKWNEDNSRSFSKIIESNKKKIPNQFLIDYWIYIQT